MQHRLIVLSTALALLTSIGAAQAQAQVATPARDSQSTISFSDLSFRDASLRIDATQSVAPGSNGNKNERFGVSPNLRDYSVTSAGDVNVTLNSLTPPDDRYPFFDFDLNVGSSGGGSWTISESFGADRDPYGFGPLYLLIGRNDVFQDFVNSTLPALELYLPIGGLVDTGGSFGIGFTIAGDWSSTGGLSSTTGQYYLAGLDPSWEIDTPFVYDAVTNLTRFHATNGRYEGVNSDHPSPFLDIYFFGASMSPAVPEPAPWMMMIFGFGLVGAGLRRAKRVRTPGVSGVPHLLWPTCRHSLA